MVVFRLRARILAEPPVGRTIAPNRTFLTAKTTPYSLKNVKSFSLKEPDE